MSGVRDFSRHAPKPAVIRVSRFGHLDSRRVHLDLKTDDARDVPAIQEETVGPHRRSRAVLWMRLAGASWARAMVAVRTAA